MSDSQHTWTARAIGTIIAGLHTSKKGGAMLAALAQSMELTRGETSAQPSTEPPTPQPSELTDEDMERLSREATARALERNGRGSAERFSIATRLV